MDNRFAILETKERVLADNDAQAAKVRQRMRRQNVFFVNLMSSPGAGKTTTLVRTIRALNGQYRIGVMEADVDSYVDAGTISALGVPVIQLHTGGACHMDADMTARGLEQFDTQALDIVFLENVGNLVCPAECDVGADKRVMILSVPEGDDKPLKYPLMFSVSDCLLVNKIDTAELFDFSLEALSRRAHELNPRLTIIPLSAKTGEGFGEWLAWLKQAAAEKQGDGR
jgi:hydrogenase nickel incorporation protein HypB